MRSRSALTLGVLVATSLPLATLLAGPALASPQDAGTGSATVGVGADGWYSTSPACTASPTGCLPAAAPSTYPAKTLQVGATAGQEDSRAYLALDLASLPSATSLTGGSLRIPVAPDADGTRSADTAKLQACLVTAAFKDDAEGGAEVPPTVDCKKASSPAKYAAGAGSAPAAFTVDLGAFAAAWSSGSANQGLALLPAADTAPTDFWHVAIAAHDSKVDAAQRVTATVTFAAASAVDSFDDTPVPTAAPAAPADAGLSSGSFAAPPLAPDTTPVLTAPAAVAPAPQPQMAPTAQLQPQAFSVPGTGYAYPVVFLLPIVLLGAIGWLARALTQDLTPRLP
jgi:hypothetical protein